MLSLNHSQLLSEIAIHAQIAGRDPASIQVIAVTKYATLEQMKEAYALGIRDFGESRLQVALLKRIALPADVRWHFIGALQSNKIGKIIEHFDYIHSVDSLEIAQMIAKKSLELQKWPSLFLQVNISGETSKRGFSEAELLENFEAIVSLKLNFIGLMTMAPLTSDINIVQGCFQRLRLLQEQLAPKFSSRHLSMGMSEDFPIAIGEGSTFLRIGSLLFQNSTVSDVVN